jgi:hypothetical protein
MYAAPGVVVRHPHVVEGIERNLEYVLLRLEKCKRNSVECAQLDASFNYFLSRLKREGMQDDARNYQARRDGVKVRV